MTVALRYCWGISSKKKALNFSCRLWPYFQMVAHHLHREALKWEAQGNDIIQAVKKMAVLFAKMSKYMRWVGPVHIGLANARWGSKMNFSDERANVSNESITNICRFWTHRGWVRFKIRLRSSFTFVDFCSSLIFSAKIVRLLLRNAHFAHFLTSYRYVIGSLPVKKGIHNVCCLKKEKTFKHGRITALAIQYLFFCNFFYAI